MGNLYSEKLKGNDIAVYFGTFAPLHVGHMDVINKAKRKHDGVVVITSGFKGDKGDKYKQSIGSKGLGVKRRFRCLRELYADDELVYVNYLREDGIPRMPEGWNEWLELLDEKIKDSIVDSSAKITVYVGEKEYALELKERTNYAVELMERSHINISATMIRENPLKYWNAIARTFRRHFTKKVLIVGSASGGKTTLVKDLARVFNSPFSLEYAREYQETSNVNDEELDVNDYLNLILGQYEQTNKIINSTSNNGLVVCDTNSTVTNCYSDIWLPEFINQLEPVYDMTAEREEWDLILVIPPVTKYIDDNFRGTALAEDEDRWMFHNLLMEKLVARGWKDKIELLDVEFTEDDVQGFEARYEKAKELLKTKLNIDYMDIG